CRWMAATRARLQISAGASYRSKLLIGGYPPIGFLFALLRVLAGIRRSTAGRMLRADGFVFFVLLGMPLPDQIPRMLFCGLDHVTGFMVFALVLDGAFEFYLFHSILLSHAAHAPDAAQANEWMLRSELTLSQTGSFSLTPVLADMLV